MIRLSPTVLGAGDVLIWTLRRGWAGSALIVAEDFESGWEVPWDGSTSILAEDFEAGWEVPWDGSTLIIAEDFESGW